MRRRSLLRIDDSISPPRRVAPQQRTSISARAFGMDTGVEERRGLFFKPGLGFDYLRKVPLERLSSIPFRGDKLNVFNGQGDDKPFIQEYLTGAPGLVLARQR